MYNNTDGLAVSMSDSFEYGVRHDVIECIQHITKLFPNGMNKEFGFD